MPQHAADYIKALVAKKKIVDKNFSVQVMCDELNLPKSTVDKFLSKQTETSWFNVFAMVSYLGGSLDELAGIQRSLPPPVYPPSVSSPQQDLAITLLIEQHQQELVRLTTQHTDQLDRFRRLIDQSRAALVSQHEAESAHLRAICERSLNDKDRIISIWRIVALVFLCLFVALFVYIVWELSNLHLGLTGYLIKQAGVIVD